MNFTVGVEVEGKMVWVVLVYSKGDKVLFTHKMTVFEACAFCRVLNAATHNAKLDVNMIVNGWKGDE
jgi:hypothetical protein